MIQYSVSSISSLIMSKIAKVIIVDDHTLFREGIRMLVEHEGIGTVIAEAENGHEFIALLAKHSPDLVIIDIDMPVMNGIEATKRAHVINPNLKILALTMLTNKDSYIQMVEAGAKGYVLKTAGKQEILNAIQCVLAGQNYYSKEILQRVVTDFMGKPSQGQSAVLADALTSKELEVLEYLCFGLSPNEIADRIHRSVKTVEVHRSKLLEKTNTKNTINLVIFAFKNGLVNPL